MISHMAIALMIRFCIGVQLHRCRDIKPQNFGVMTLTIWGHVTSLIICGFLLLFSLNRLSCTGFEILVIGHVTIGLIIFFL